MMDDRQLLARYVAEVSEEAFAELARRHMGLVYSAALRQVRNQQLAQDVTQVVFANLARRARSIPEGTVLAGWLHRDTRYTALDVIRAEARRLRREQQSVEMNSPNPDPQPGWEEIRPLLDEALTQLAPADRDAVLLRYFEQRDFAGVGEALGASAEAARKRVDRALERLREQLLKRGITTTAAALGGALAVHAVESVPAGLVVSLASGSAVAGGGFMSNLLIMTKAKITIGLALAAGIVATPLILQQQAMAAARAEQAELQTRLRELPAQTVPANQQAPKTFDTVARDRADLERLRREAIALRAKITDLSAQAQQLAAANRAHKPGSTLLGEVLRMRGAHDAGQTTPAATMQTFMWAFSHGDTNRITQLLVADAGTDPQRVQQALEKIFKECTNSSQIEAAEKENLEINLLEEQPGQDNDKWVVTAKLGADGNSDATRVLLRPTDTGWKWVIATNGQPVEEPIRDQP
jgi:RNA polymerase sigma factor (sigma-70 family)